MDSTDVEVEVGQKYSCSDFVREKQEREFCADVGKGRGYTGQKS